MEANAGLESVPLQMPTQTAAVLPAVLCYVSTSIQSDNFVTQLNYSESRKRSCCCVVVVFDFLVTSCLRPESEILESGILLYSVLTVFINRILRHPYQKCITHMGKRETFHAEQEY